LQLLVLQGVTLFVVLRLKTEKNLVKSVFSYSENLIALEKYCIKGFAYVERAKENFTLNLL